MVSIRRKRLINERQTYLSYLLQQNVPVVNEMALAKLLLRSKEASHPVQLCAISACQGNRKNHNRQPQLAICYSVRCSSHGK